MTWPWQWKRRDDDLNDEIRTHLEMAVHDRIENGESACEAERSARKHFGNSDLIKDVTRDMWSGRWLHDCAQDGAYALRILRKNGLVSAFLVMIAALGIGSATCVFSVSDAILRKGDPNWYRWGAVTGKQPRRNARMFHFSIPEFVELSRLRGIFEETGALRWSEMALTSGEYPERVACARVTPEVISMNVHPLFLGRNFALTKIVREARKWLF